MAFGFWFVENFFGAWAEVGDYLDKSRRDSDTRSSVVQPKVKSICKLYHAPLST